MGKVAMKHASQDSTLDSEYRVAELYRSLWENIDTIRTPEIVSQFLYNVDLDGLWFAGKRCLDVGCGSGFAVWSMEQLGARCFACDISVSSLRAVRERLADSESRHGLVGGSALRLPFPSDNFDFVHCNGVLHHTTDPRKGFEELVRVTRPGGTVFVSLYGKGGIYNAILGLGRALNRIVPYRLTERVLGAVLGDRKVPNSFVPAKVSILDNMYVPIRQSYQEREIRRWFEESGVASGDVMRTATTIYDHKKRVNRLIHGEGYLQFRATLPQPKHHKTASG
jgi:SAM-dependent methyltransferase